MKEINIIGSKYGKLIVIKKDEKKIRCSYICECECGRIKSIRKENLIYGLSKSCGCMAGRRKKNLRGKRFGFLTIISELPNINGRVQWLCHCDCGNKKNIRLDSLNNGNTKSCGCWVNKKDLMGEKFGRLLVIKEALNKNKATRWLCQCDCGNKKEIPTKSLLRTDNPTNSCGCLLREYNDRHKLPYGKSSFNRLLSSYKRGAKKRNLEFNLNNDQFENMTQQNCYYCGDKPSTVQTGKTHYGEYIYNGIDRINNDAGYILSNCVPCCCVCNRMKMKLHIDDFLGRIKKIYHKRF